MCDCKISIVTYCKHLVVNFSDVYQFYRDWKSAIYLKCIANRFISYTIIDANFFVRSWKRIQMLCKPYYTSLSVYLKKSYEFNHVFNSVTSLKYAAKWMCFGQQTKPGWKLLLYMLPVLNSFLLWLVIPNCRKCENLTKVTSNLTTK